MTDTVTDALGRTMADVRAARVKARELRSKATDHERAAMWLEQYAADLETALQDLSPI